MKTYRFFWMIFLLLTLVLSGCGEDEEPTPTPTKTPAAAAQQAPAAAAATNTPAPAAGGESAAAAPAPAPAGEEPTATPQPETIATVNTDLLNVRSGPSTGDAIVQTVGQGQQFTVIGRTADNAWLQLAENGRELGWVAAEFVSTSQNAAPSQGGGEQEIAQSEPDTAAQPEARPDEEDEGPPPATMSSPDFGSQAFLWWRPEVAERDLDLMREAGFNWVKQSFAWETIEGHGKGQFDWDIADEVAERAADRGLKLLARLSSDPEKRDFWAGPPPQNGDNFADFAFAIAKRYDCTDEGVGCIQAYQIWNEPNLAREWGGNRPDPAGYAEFLRKAYAAIKRGNPNAIVISAGMAPTGDNNENAMPDDLFYDGMYAAMGSSNGYFDMLGVHGAGFAAPPELDPAEAASNQQYGGYRFFAFRHVEDIRAIMERYGDAAKKIVLLEFGWTYDRVNPSYKWHGADAGIDEYVQADYLKRAYQYAAANWQPWIALMSVITMPNLDWTNDGNPQDEEQYWWAIMEPTPADQLSLRPAFVELCAYFNQAKGQACKYQPQ